MTPVKILDIKKIIRSDGSTFVKSLPNPIINWIAHKIHQDELNAIHNKYLHLFGIDYVSELVKEFKVDLKIERAETLPRDGRFIYIANHPQGGLDAISFLKCIHDAHGDVVSPSNQLFEYVPNLRPVILGINAFGTSSREKAKAVNEAFNGNRPIMIFPAGAVSRKIKGEIIDLKWHKSFVTKAIQSKRDIIPSYIDIRNSNYFYNFAKLRVFLGIKTTIETALLPNEMFKNVGEPLKIKIGKRIPYQSLTKEFSHKEWTEKIKKIVYDLR